MAQMISLGIPFICDPICDPGMHQEVVPILEWSQGLLGCPSPNQSTRVPLQWKTPLPGCPNKYDIFILIESPGR